MPRCRPTDMDLISSRQQKYTHRTPQSRSLLPHPGIRRKFSVKCANILYTSQHIYGRGFLSLPNQARRSSSRTIFDGRNEGLRDGMPIERSCVTATEECKCNVNDRKRGVIKKTRNGIEFFKVRNRVKRCAHSIHVSLPSNFLPTAFLSD